MKKKMAFDLHGVVLYLFPAMAKYYKEVVGFELNHSDNFSFPYPEWYNPARFGPDIARSIVKYAKDMKPMRGSIQALERYYDTIQRKVIFVTASAESTMKANKEWLDKWLTVPYVIYRVDHGTGKVGMITQLNITHYIDDRFKTCMDLSKYIDTVYLYDAPYNRGRELRENIIRVSNLNQAVVHFLK